jgi:hypothetical protein
MGRTFSTVNFPTLSPVLPPGRQGIHLKRFYLLCGKDTLFWPFFFRISSNFWPSPLRLALLAGLNPY